MPKPFWEFVIIVHFTVDHTQFGTGRQGVVQPDRECIRTRAALVDTTASCFY